MMKTMTTTIFGMPADERRLLYQFAIETGLRAEEIRTRTIAHIA